MLKRIITGAVYVAVIVGFFFLRQYVDYRAFDSLLLILCGIGSFEVSRALSGFTNRFTFLISRIAGVLFVVQFWAFQYVMKTGYGYLFALALLALALIAVLIYNAFAKEKRGKWWACIVSVIYPTLLFLPLLLMGTIGKQEGFIALLFAFAVPAVSDTFAYLVGKTYNAIRKGKAKKLSPTLSPNKTIAGAIGGLVGGMACTLILWIVFYGTVSFATACIVLLIGLVAAVLTEAGDLIESAIKRKAGIKDIGNILPGHGGVMDRIDGLILCAAYIFLVFGVL